MLLQYAFQCVHICCRYTSRQTLWLLSNPKLWTGHYTARDVTWQLNPQISHFLHPRMVTIWSIFGTVFVFEFYLYLSFICICICICINISTCNMVVKAPNLTLLPPPGGHHLVNIYDHQLLPWSPWSRCSP